MLSQDADVPGQASAICERSHTRQCGNLRVFTRICNSSSPHRLARPRTSPFHGGNGGSNPPGDAIDFTYFRTQATPPAQRPVTSTVTMGPELDSSIHRRFFIVAYPRSIGPHEARARGDGNPGELRACDGAVHLLQSGWFATIICYSLVGSRR